MSDDPVLAMLERRRDDAYSMLDGRQTTVDSAAFLNASSLYAIAAEIRRASLLSQPSDRIADDRAAQESWLKYRASLGAPEWATERDFLSGWAARGRQT